jgi:hypothetical protein
MDVPRLADETTRQRFVADLCRLADTTGDEACLADFLRAWDARSETRPHVGLPQGPAEQNSPLTMETRVRLAVAPCLAFDRHGDGGAPGFELHGRRWSCSEDVVPALAALSLDRSRPVAELCAMLASAGAVAKLKLILTAMLLAGDVVRDNPGR